ncbi:hypothetical protein ECG_02742 [Echinococcus granulosus]|nr:hypothetical protein ECG_02742 [Echinococcus granulosus]
MFAKVREFSVEVFKKVEKRKDEVLRLDDTEKKSRREKNGKKPEFENGYEESVGAHVAKEGPKDIGRIGMENKTKVQFDPNKFVKATDEEKETTETGTEVKEGDRELENLAKGSNLKFPRCNEGGKVEVPTQEKAVIEKGIEELVEVNEDNEHCQEAEKTEADLTERALKAMKMCMNNGSEADSNETDANYATKQTEKAKGKSTEGIVGTESGQEDGRIEKAIEMIKMGENADDEEDKENTDELNGVKALDKKKEVENEEFKIAEKKVTRTIEVPVDTVELTGKEEGKENLDKTAEVEEVKLFEVTGGGDGGLEDKESKVKQNGVEPKEVVIDPIEINEEVEGEENFIDKVEVEIKSDATTKAEPKEKQLEESGKQEVSVTYEEMEIFEMDENKKGKESSSAIVWTEAVQPVWEEGLPREEESEMEMRHCHEEVDVKEETSVSRKKSETNKAELIDKAQPQEIEPGEELLVKIEVGELPELKLEEEEVEVDKFQELDVGMQLKRDVESQNEMGEEESVNKRPTKQQECKRDKTAAKFILPAEVQTAELVMNTTAAEEEEAEHNSDLVTNLGNS